VASSAAPQTLRGKAGGPVPKAEQSIRTRALIIDTGIRCIAEFGYANTSMHLIAQQAGLSRGPVHYHFADKNDLMGAIAEALPQRAPEPTRRRLAEARTTEERMKALVDISLEQHLGDHHFVAIELLIAARRDPQLASSVLPHFSAGEANIDQWFMGYAEGLGWEPERLLAFRTVFVAALRGLAIDHLQQADGGGHSAAAAMLKDMMLQYLLRPAAKD
jgi:AcrR family transcriptional regulator